MLLQTGGMIGMGATMVATGATAGANRDAGTGAKAGAGAGASMLADCGIIGTIGITPDPIVIAEGARAGAPLAALTLGAAAGCKTCMLS